MVKMSRAAPKWRGHFDKVLSDLCCQLSTGIGALGRGAAEPENGERRGLTPSAEPAAEVSGGVMATAVSEVFDGFERRRTPRGDYQPSANEEFMSPVQLAYFRQKLLDWKDSLVRESRDTMAQLKSGPIREADVTDRASSETDWAIELRTRDRQRKLISKIDSALRRIETGEYGYCEMTGEPISLKRLDARPIATMTLEAQERHERRERVHRDD